jgi:hypothetical protein
VDWDENPEEVFVTEMESHRLRELVVRIHIARMDVYANVRRITAAQQSLNRRTLIDTSFPSYLIAFWRFPAHSCVLCLWRPFRDFFAVMQIVIS